MKILHIDSSILSDNSVSRHLSQTVLNQIVSQYSLATVIYRDLAKNPPAHLSTEVFSALRTNSTASLNPIQLNEFNAIHQSIQEIKEADVIILGAPMYNLTVSSGLKTWTDQICQAGLTFKYTAQGPQGLVNNKPVIIVSSRGGIYSTEPYDAFDFQEPFLRSILGLIGITNVTIIRAEGVNVSEEQKEQAITQALQQIKQLHI